MAAAPLTRPGTAPVAFATESVLAWQRVASSSFVPLVVDDLTDGRFAGRLSGRLLEGVFFSRMRVTPHEVHRTPALIDASQRLFYKVTLLLEGTGELVQDDRRALMLPGSVSVYDTARPYDLRFADPIDAVVIMFPRDLIAFANPRGGQQAWIEAMTDRLGRLGLTSPAAWADFAYVLDGLGHTGWRDHVRLQRFLEERGTSLRQLVAAGEDERASVLAEYRARHGDSGAPGGTGGDDAAVPRDVAGTEIRDEVPSGYDPLA